MVGITNQRLRLMVRMKWVKISSSTNNNKNDLHGRQSYQSNQLHRHRGDHNEASDNSFLDSLLRSEAAIDEQLTKRDGTNAVVNRKEVSDVDGDIPNLRESSSDEVDDGVGYRGTFTEEDERMVSGETVGTGEIFRSRELMNIKYGSSVPDNYSYDGGVTINQIQILKLVGL